MKKILLPLAVASAIAAGSAGAATTLTSPSFNVTVNLTSACAITSAPTALVFNYTSLQTSAASPVAGGGAFQVTCTNTLPYTLALDNGGGTFPSTGLAYTIGLSATTGTGNGSAQSYSVTGSIGPNQAGTCGSGACSESVAHTLTVTY